MDPVIQALSGLMQLTSKKSGPAPITSPDCRPCFPIGRPPKSLAQYRHVGLVRQQVISFDPRDFCLQGRGMDAFQMEQARIEDEDWIVEFLSAFQAEVYHFHPLQKRREIALGGR
ncbi:hypothetical protein [Paracoccus mutanolyticus]|uniref:hypothetical protein n=1 Tax=Paracoccus mutanolyticus TaxID=1499308 RepID=UPI0016740B3B|nr:hypothetical protein [Paracoccus mutanolyticus]